MFCSSKHTSQGLIWTYLLACLYIFLNVKLTRKSNFLVLADKGFQGTGPSGTSGQTCYMINGQFAAPGFILLQKKKPVY